MKLTPEETKQIREEFDKCVPNNGEDIFTETVSDWWLSRINTLLEEKGKGLVEKIIEGTTYDHSKCPLPQSCTGYMNGVEDSINIIKNQ